MTSRRKVDGMAARLQQELAPYPGRLAGSLRDTLGVVLALTAAMTLRVPGISLALALLFLMQRERPGLTFRVGMQIFLGAATACAASFLWVQATDGTDVARFLGMMIMVFVASFCMTATTTPLFWTIFGFYGFVDLSAWDAHHSANAIVTSSLYNIASLGLVVACAALVEYLFGTRHPADELQQEMQKRLSALGRFFHMLADGKPARGSEEFRSRHNALVQLAHAGDLYLNELYDRLRDSSPDLSQVPLGIHYRIGLLTRAIEKSVVFGFKPPHQEERNHREAYLLLAELCDRLSTSGDSAQLHTLSPEEPYLLREVFLELQQYAKTLELTHQAPIASQPNTSSKRDFQFFLPGVFESNEATVYALKLTLAATVCYVVYNAVAWPGILTSVVTVLFTGLSSTGAMKQKQLYRFSGAAIGGALGIATVALLYPNMDSITALILIVAPVALLSGWVLRSPRMSYVGVQIAFGFFLTAIPGFTATTQLTPARDRVIGVALGILVMWFIFDQLWPVRTSDALEKSLIRIREATEQLQLVGHSSASPENRYVFDRLRAIVSLELANVQQLDFAARFEAGRHRKREMARSRRLIREIEFRSAEFYAAALQISSARSNAVPS